MILEMKLLQEYSDTEGKKQDILKFAFEDTVNAKDMSIEYIKNGDLESHNVVFIDNDDIDELIWFLQTIKQKNSNEDNNKALTK